MISRLEEGPGAVSSVSHLTKKRLASLRRNDTPEGARFTVTSDSPLNDYSAYVEGERFFVLIPQATLVGALKNGSGRGFTDLRMEQRDDDVVLSFILQPGATVNFNQTFNRLDVNFITNERANKANALLNHASQKSRRPNKRSQLQMATAEGERDFSRENFRPTY